MSSRILSILASGLLLTACGGESVTAPTAQREVLTNPSFMTDINSVLLQRGCASGSCHGSGAGGLTLTENATTNFSRLVGVQAVAEPFQLVEAGDAQNSYLVIKIEGRQTRGSIMPRGGSPLDAIDKANIRNWIDNGAPNN